MFDLDPRGPMDVSTLPAVAHSSSPPFEMFAPPHLATIAVILGVAAVLPWIARKLDRRREIAIGLAVVMAGGEITKVVVRTAIYDFPLATNLPLSLCGIASFLGAAMLIWKNERLWELVYFWGMGGTLQAIATPDLEWGYPHPIYLFYFLTHGAIIVAAIYGLWSYGFRPTWAALPRVFLTLNLYAALVTPINLLLDANYLYLRAKPVQASLMDYFGPWPWYLLSLEAMALLSFVVYYLPFAAWDGWLRGVVGRARSWRRQASTGPDGGP
ncbi:MAG: TIGR02206 family membrane protein [Acidobacteriota bacterium]